MFFVFSALLEYALVNYASRSDAQRLAKLKSKKQLELDHCAFDPEHMMNDDLPPGHGPPPPPPPPMGPPGMPPPLPPVVPPLRQGLNGGGGSFSMVRVLMRYKLRRYEPDKLPFGSVKLKCLNKGKNRNDIG